MSAASLYPPLPDQTVAARTVNGTRGITVSNPEFPNRPLHATRSRDGRHVALAMGDDLITATAIRLDPPAIRALRRLLEGLDPETGTVIEDKDADHETH
ncbi:hypothetical protein [Bifidobacterium leontopitheci]|uniref:Uncharacterized protein n=1 Tax=Bifidobacterium leontopitheci TaxID=2650774 RepID=A0A6I1GG66_9BIFI|nr:hypothetical protein [Bifidobacterium leontopitheci]KAB7790565.1 hypothetical protein F7D09_0934 [Bifidobacterium leontopitheci]